MSHPERIIPDEVEPGVVALHLKRYTFAETYTSGKDVLDACCGVGYGSAFLARTATRVVGVDVDGEAIEYARSRYSASNVEFDRMDVTDLRLPDASFDVVCAFEAIEHLADASSFLREVARVLRRGGTFVVSTPQAPETMQRPANPFHVVEYARDDFAALLRSHFGRVDLYGQRRPTTLRHRVLQRLDVFGLRRKLALGRTTTLLVGTAPTVAVTLDDVVIDQSHLDDATELVAVCTEPRRG